MNRDARTVAYARLLADLEQEREAVTHTRAPFTREDVARAAFKIACEHLLADADADPTAARELAEPAVLRLLAEVGAAYRAAGLAPGQLAPSAHTA